MSWSALITLITNYGLPFAIQMWQKWSSPAPVTQADIDQLVALGKNTARTHMMDAFVRAGIDPASPQAIALLALVPADPAP